ncbi:MAG: nucleoside triphosphate pyrophosphohydrolase [Lachnospiraceae bacterium]|nr:nucleoside triphosphate pyrophosphohydrolase [Lachnospiraceae bacterium]
MYTFKDLIAIVKRLRAKDGCPWDRVQTHESLRGCMLEEAYEAVDAIDRSDVENLKEELGDVLMQVVMHAEIASEEGQFTLEEVIDGISEKLVRRHPHVFGMTEENSQDGVQKTWEEIKQIEKNEETAWDGLKRIPLVLPACLRAQKIQKKMEKAGYHLASVETMNTKIHDINLSTETLSEEIIGEVLFYIVLAARKAGIDAEQALAEYNKEFVNKIIGQN